MNKTIPSLAALIAASATAVAAGEIEPASLEPAGTDPGAWRVSVGMRAAPGVKTRASVDGRAAVGAAGGRVRPVSVSGAGGAATTVFETTTDGGTTSSGTSKADAEAASGYRAAATRYEFDNGYVDLEDAAGVAGETTNWHFDSADAFDGGAFTVSGEKNYESVTTRKTTTQRTTATTTTAGGSGAGSASLREEYGPTISDSSDDTMPGFEVQLGRTLWEDADFGIELNAGWTIYNDIDCFRMGGRAYSGVARSTGATGGAATTRKTDTIETTTMTTQSGSIATVISQPEFTDLSDIQNPDGSIGGASYDGLPTQTGWGTPVLVVSSDRFSVEDRPGETTTETQSVMTEGTPETTITGGGAAAKSASRTRVVDVRSRGELSLQELRFGVSPTWKATPRLRLRADTGILGAYAEVKTRTTVLADGAAVASFGRDDDDWKLQGYAGLSAACRVTDRLELTLGASVRFPDRKVRFDDGVVAGSVELPKWDAFAAATVMF